MWCLYHSSDSKELRATAHNEQPLRDLVRVIAVLVLKDAILELDFLALSPGKLFDSVLHCMCSGRILVANLVDAGSLAPAMPMPIFSSLLRLWRPETLAPLVPTDTPVPLDSGSGGSGAGGGRKWFRWDTTCKLTCTLE
jgi:hypothetical protein